MKHIYNRIPKKYLLLLPLTLVGLIIWQWSPALPIAHHFPLRQPQKRLALILALFLVWAIRYLLWDLFKPAKPDNLNLAQMLHALRGHFLGAIRFLKKTIIDKNGYSTPLNKLPWYLLIGPPGSGKTTLLSNSNVSFILSKQKKQEGQDKTIPSSSVCDWWVTRDLVLVDVPGCYAFSPFKDALNPDDENKEAPAKPHAQLVLWQSLLNLLIKYRQKNNISAIIVALPLPEFIKLSRQQQAQWFQDVRQRLIECWAKFGKLPVYFFVTKCDLLPGFAEFFNDIGSDELMQPWGIPLSGRKEHEKLLDLFTDRFNALIKRLNKQLIWRLHQERNPQLRPLIKDFPLQLELIKESLIYLIKTLTAANPDLDLEGIYLNSGTQENVSAHSATLFHHDLPSALDLLPTSPFIPRAYFIKHVISYLLPHTSHHLIQRFRQKKTWLPQLVYGLGFITLFIGALGLGKDFQRGLYQLANVQRYLVQYQLYLQQNNAQDTSSIAAITTALPLLNTLQAAAQTPVQTSRLGRIEKPYSTQSQQTAAEIYHKALQTIVLPQIRNEFEKYLETASDKNPEQLYLALKAYLMLRRQDGETEGANKSHANSVLQSQFILQTLGQISPSFSKKSLDKELAQPSLLQHLQTALQLKQANVLNNHLITQTRKILNALPDADLAYILVKTLGENNQESLLNFGTNIGTPPALISKGTMTQIPYMFTAAAFPMVIKDYLPQAAEETIKGNEILGKKFYRPEALISSAEAVASLTQQLEKSYISNYIDIWESLVDNISLNSPKNLTETDAMIMNLISAHSPLLQLLQTIHTNTDLEPILSNSFKLQTLNTLFNQTQTQQKDSLYEIFTDLGELHQYLQQESLQKADLKKTAFQDPILRIRGTTDKYPDPIKNWLQTLLTYTQNYLQPANKTLSNQKVLINEAALESTPEQNLYAIPAIPTGISSTLNLKQKTLLTKAKSHEKKDLALAQEEPQESNDGAKQPLKQVLRSGDYARALAEGDRKLADKNKPESSLKQPSQNGEYVQILSDNPDSRIFVERD